MEYRRHLSTFPILFRSAFYLVYFMACKLGLMAKYENPMKNWLIIQLTKFSSIRASVHPTVRQSAFHLCDGLSFSPSARPSVCPSARPSVCPSVVLPVRHTFKFIESYDKLWITLTSLWSSNILKNAPVLDKKKSFVTLIGCKAKSSQRHRMWGMNVNLSDTCDINDWMAEITT